MTRQQFSTNTDYTTHDGGYRFAIRRIDREDLTLEEIREWLIRHHDTPRSERNAFWQGVEGALSETIGRIVRERETTAATVAAQSAAQEVARTVALYDVLHTAIATGAALPILYASGGDLVKERVIQPVSIEVGTHGSDLVFAHDSIRQRIISLRLDRVIAWGAGA